MQVATADQLFLQHVQELRRRLLWSCSVVILAAVVSYIYRRPIVAFITNPLHQSLIYTAPSGGLQFILQICLGVGLAVALPIFVYNTLRFVEPAFSTSQAQHRRSLTIIGSSLILAVMGLAFGYWLILPMSLHFFAGFNVGPIRALISTSEYLSFTIGCLVTFAVIFQLPLLLLVYNKIRPFPPGTLRKYRRHVIIGSLGLAVILPFTYDPITQFVIAIPVIVLYEVSVISVWLINRSHYKALRQPQSPVLQPTSAVSAAPLSYALSTDAHSRARQQLAYMQLAARQRRPIQMG